MTPQTKAAAQGMFFGVLAAAVIGGGEWALLTWLKNFSGQTEFWHLLVVVIVLCFFGLVVVEIWSRKKAREQNDDHQR